MKIRDFVQQFFAFYGAEIHADGNGLHIQLKPSNPSYTALREALGQEEFRLVFDLHEFLPDTELMMLGHPLLDRMDQFLKRQGSKTAVVLPKRYRISKKEARQHFFRKTRGAKKRSVKIVHHEGFQDELFFHFKIHYASALHHQEEILSEGIHLVSGDPIPLQQLELLNEGEEMPRWKPPETFNRFYEQVLARMLEKVRIRATHLEKQLWEELKHSGIRLEDYYRHQIQDIPNKDFLVQDRKIAQLQNEFHHQIKLLTEKHQLNVTTQLLGYAVLRVPSQYFRFQFSKGSALVHYNRFQGEWYPLFCQKCHSRQTAESSYFFSETGEIFCSTCGTVCPECQALSGALSTCVICGKNACVLCMSSCFQCHQSLCLTDQKECFFCKQNICQNCSFQCMLCLSSGCTVHFFEFDSRRYCEQCLLSCKRCARKVPKSNKKNCPVCGQQFCEFCFQKCRRCSNEYCTMHTECNNCGEKS